MTDANIKSMKANNGSLDLELEGGACRLLAEAFSEQFIDSGATNYLEVSFYSEKTGPLIVTMQRAGAITPAGKVAKIKELIKVGEIEAALAV